MENREHLDVLKKERTILLEVFVGDVEPGGQNETGLIVSQESIAPVGKHRKPNGIILMMSGEIECRNFPPSMASLTEGESTSRLFKLVCRGPKCAGLNCNHGCYKAVGEDRRKILDESDMFILHIVSPAPLNGFCRNLLKKRNGAGDIH